MRLVVGQWKKGRWRLQGCRVHSFLRFRAVQLINDENIIKVACPGIEPGLRPSQSRVRSATLTGFPSLARRGVEPRLAVSRTAVRSGTLAGCVMNQYPDLDLNQGLNLRRVQCKSATPSGQRHER